MQEALKRILKAVFEPDFYNEIMGFRTDKLSAANILRGINDEDCNVYQDDV